MKIAFFSVMCYDKENRGRDAGHSGLQVIGISCITNMAAGVMPVKRNHVEVAETAAKVHNGSHKLVDRILTII